METNRFYVGGRWVLPSSQEIFTIYNPANGEKTADISVGTGQDVAAAVAAAGQAFPSYANTTPAARLDLLARIVRVLRERQDILAHAVTTEMGAPISFARSVQVATAIAHFEHAAKALAGFEFEHTYERYCVTYEPIGVCGLITAWNWPLALIASKLAYALAAGCTVVLKPSEFAPLSPLLLTQALHDAGVPPGVFNLVNGVGAVVGQAISSHPDIDMVSFTGSTRAGILVAKSAADTVKRVHQELGGKSPNILLPDVDLEKAVNMGVRRAFSNAGQSCQAPTRMFVHRSQYDAALGFAKACAESLNVGDPFSQETELGPVISEIQWTRVQALIKAGIDEGAEIVTGGLGRPDHLDRGFFVRPTIFGAATNDMTIARQEIFGPALPIIPYESEEDALRMANDTEYGLASYIQSQDLAKARRLAAKIRAGRVYINTVVNDLDAPFGGYKHSGNGREQGVKGLEEYLETKAILT